MTRNTVFIKLSSFFFNALSGRLFECNAKLGSAGKKQMDIEDM